MQRRNAIIAAIALVALVLIPAAAIACAPGSGIGHRGGGIGTRNLSDVAPAWAGNATAPHLGDGDCTGAGDCAGNTSCIGNQTRGRDRLGERCVDTDGETAGGQVTTHPQLRGRAGAANQTCTDATARTPGPQGRGGRGASR